MLSGKLLHLIESHQEQISANIVSSIHHHPELHHFGRLPEVELRERCREILENLGHWLARGNDETLASEYEAIGNIRFKESVPLDECVHGLCIVKNKMIDFVDEQGMVPDTLSLYAEEQLLRRIGPFFDLLIIHMVRGYEAARRRAEHVAV